MLLLAKNYKADFDPTGWHLSEKIDGIRAFWNGKQLISRNNIPFNAPDWFIECLPSNIQLDGELWISRKGFNEISSVVRTEKDRIGHVFNISFSTFRTMILGR